MAQTFQINGSNLTYIAGADWPDQAGTQALDGDAPLLRWRRHVWSTNVMSASEWDTLAALEGQKVSITTTDYSDRNSDYATYYGCDFERLSGRHEGPVFVDVRAEFMVRI